MKKVIALILAIFILPSIPVLAEETVTGDGTPENPYVLTKQNADELIKRGLGDDGRGVCFTFS